MFVKAIETVSSFTRAIHCIVRYWNSETIVPGTATLFFVNGDGWALTCAHVARQFIDASEYEKRFTSFKDERSVLPAGHTGSQSINALAKKYGLADGQVVELHNRLVNCVEGPLGMDIILHPSLDLALIKFSGFSRLLVSQFPVFAKEVGGLKPGRSLCRLGFPFPEFNNYRYDPQTDRIGWTDSGYDQTPQFPIDGMVTRLVANESGRVVAFETSTPGLRGQSGGPAFDVDGRIWGMQSVTKHLDLNFDVSADLRRGHENKRVQESAFLHVGVCLHVDAIKAFMREHRVAFQEG